MQKHEKREQFKSDMLDKAEWLRSAAELIGEAMQHILNNAPTERDMEVFHKLKEARMINIKIGEG